ncbi:HPr family phosphocarrier protein [Alkalibacillus aidingensis]|uniref:HPr family phosphocarrier protein n=1 Tax=Alkalibacillus aidingensis TaxID=2747607 RepID=UPI001661574B|nr:HPr family phosphocarrier protein [Alkalibacillus aidingensis]
MLKAYTIPFEEGFHARPASNFINTVKDFDGAVKVKKGDKEVDAKSMIQIMTLAAKKGDEIEVIVDGEVDDQDDLIKKLDELFEG